MPLTPLSQASYDHVSTSRLTRPSPVDAEYHISTFRDRKLKYFPFLHILPDMTADRMLVERPVLWSCIMATTSKSTLQQTAYYEKVRQLIFQKMMLELQSNIDLLLGLLAYIGWANCQSQKTTSLSLFTQMAVSLVFSLGINKSQLENSKTIFNNSLHSCSELSEHSPQALEESRAVLACFLVTSS